MSKVALGCLGHGVSVRLVVFPGRVSGNAVDSFHLGDELRCGAVNPRRHQLVQRQTGHPRGAHLAEGLQAEGLERVRIEAVDEFRSSNTFRSAVAELRPLLESFEPMTLDEVEWR
mgnify:CR=1 FL=1